MMKKLVFDRTLFFILFALAAIILMGATLTGPMATDLEKTAKALAGESSGHFNATAAIIRANTIK